MVERSSWTRWLRWSVVAMIAAAISIPSSADAQRRSPPPKAERRPPRAPAPPPPRGRKPAPKPAPRAPSSKPKPTPRPSPRSRPAPKPANKIRDRAYVAFMGRVARQFRSGRHRIPLTLVAGTVVDAGSVAPGDSTTVAEIDLARTPKAGPLATLRAPAKGTLREYLAVSFEARKRGRSTTYVRSERIVGITTQPGGRVTVHEFEKGRWIRLASATASSRAPKLAADTPQLHSGGWRLVVLKSPTKVHRQVDRMTAKRVCMLIGCPSEEETTEDSKGPGTYWAYGKSSSPENRRCHHYCSSGDCVACCLGHQVADVASEASRAVLCHATVGGAVADWAMHAACDMQFAVGVTVALAKSAKCSLNCNQRYKASGSDNPHQCKTK